MRTAKQGELKAKVLECLKDGGLFIADIAKAIDRPASLTDGIVKNCINTGVVFVAGIKGHRKYFLTKDEADAFELIAHQVREERLKASKERTLANERARNARRCERERAARGLAPVKVNLAPKKSGVKLGKPDPKKLHLAATIVWPETVKVQVCPRFPDRFAFEPPKGWKGQITRDQRARWLEAASGASVY